MEPRRYGQESAHALIAAAQSLGLETRLSTGADQGHDAVVTVPGGGTVFLEIKTASLVTADSAPGQLRRWSISIEPDAVPLVVADRITADGRDQLTRAGWSWLDLRGHLRLVGPGLFVDSDVPTLTEPRPAREGLSGQVGIELAALLLLDPTTRIGVRSAAAALGRAPSSISEAYAALHVAGLVDAKRRPAVPELFWELAARWETASRDVATIPGEGRDRDTSALHIGFENVESTVGWALSDTMAAALYGAPVSMRADHPRDFHVPDHGTLRRAVQLLGPAVSPSARAARIRVAPVPLVCARRIDGTEWANDEWPLAHPLFVALDLAQDPGRGREILDAWTPREPWARVW
jgi:hypothetical protein